MSKWYQDALGYMGEFVKKGGRGADPFAKVYEARRAEYSLFTTQMTDAEIEKLRSYIF